MLPEIKKPLIFGDLDTINAIKETERINEFNLLAWCAYCSGKGSCNECLHECDYCDGVGKDHEALAAFRSKYPRWEVKL